MPDAVLPKQNCRINALIQYSLFYKPKTRFPFFSQIALFKNAFFPIEMLCCSMIFFVRWTKKIRGGPTLDLRRGKVIFSMWIRVGSQSCIH